MATVTKVQGSASVFGKVAVEYGDKAWKAWTAEVWQPLGVKDRTAQQRASADGKGGTRSAMLAVMSFGFTDIGLAMQSAAYIRNKYLGCAATNTNGISFQWFAVATNMATVTSNAVFKADAKGTWKMVAKSRAAKPQAKRTPKAPSTPSASADGPVATRKMSAEEMAAMQAEMDMAKSA